MKAVENGGEGEAGACMSSVAITLKNLFDGGALAQNPASLTSNVKLESLRVAVSKRVADVTWSATFDEIMKGTEELLNIGIPEIIAWAWAKHQLLQQYADTRKHPPGETSRVPLITHVIQSVHHPYIEVFVGDQQLGRVNFEIVAELTLEGALLGIRGGRITEIQTGSCQADGRLSCEGMVLIKRETKPLMLPGVIPLKEGIPIASL